MIFKDSFPWRPSGKYLELPLQGARVPSLLGELLIRFYKPGGKKKEKKKAQCFF